MSVLHMNSWPSYYKLKLKFNKSSKINKVFKAHIVYRGGSRIYLGGGALVSCSTTTPVNHIVFFLQNTNCIRNLQGTAGGGGAHPLHPPARSAPGSWVLQVFVTSITLRQFSHIVLQQSEKSSSSSLPLRRVTLTPSWTAKKEIKFILTVEKRKCCCLAHAVASSTSEFDSESHISQSETCKSPIQHSRYAF